MASWRNFILSKPSYVFPSSSETDSVQKSTEGELELEEADLWNLSSNSSTVPEAKKPSRLVPKKSSKKLESMMSSRVSPVGSSSMPVNIPDWSKILKDDYKERVMRESDEVFDEEVQIPPHEYLARTRGASLSVHEGKGRTLKGRDLRSVRNAIWKKVGFED